MSLPKTVPFELFQDLKEQLTQALQMIAALTLTDEEVISCKGSENENLSGWAESMKADLLAPGKYGREALIDMLTRYEFLTNTHAGFIYGAFEGPQITWRLAEQANLLQSMISDYESGVGEEYRSYKDLRSFLRGKLLESNPSEENADYLLELAGARIPEAILMRMK
jgi:hypothetical protein